MARVREKFPSKVPLKVPFKSSLEKLPSKFPSQFCSECGTTLIGVDAGIILVVACKFFFSSIDLVVLVVPCNAFLFRVISKSVV